MQSSRQRTVQKYLSMAQGLFDNTHKAPARKQAPFMPMNEPYRMASPDGRIHAALWAERGTLFYEGSLQGAPLLGKSPLGLITKGGHLGRNVSLGKPAFHAVSETFPNRGAKALGQETYHQYDFPVRHLTSGFTWTLSFRLWNGGVGFRYVLPQGSRGLVVGDGAEFALPNRALCFYQTDLVKMQDKTKRVLVQNMEKGLSLCCMPLFVVEEGYCMLTESEMENFAGVALVHQGGGRFSLSFWDSDPFYTANCVSPWRLAILAETPDALVNNDTIRASARKPSPALAEADWIQPGKATWSFFIRKKEARNEETIRAFVDDTAALGFPYTVIDEGWRKWAKTEEKAFDKVADIAQKAGEKGVSIWLWQASNDRMYQKRYRRQFLRRCKQAGVVGVKIDFLESESRRTIQFYREMLEDAAAEKLMVIFHNPNKPTGLARTYPHLLSREAVRGVQSNCDPEETTILPFTRMVGGDADYTPFCFSVPERRKDATMAHLLAATVTMQSSLLTISEHPANLVRHPSAEFLHALPTFYDETKALPGTIPGNRVIFARRKGERWFFAFQQNDAPENEEYTVYADFLEPETDYTLILFTDDPAENDGLLRREITLRKGGAFTFYAAAKGGAAGILEKKETES